MSTAGARGSENWAGVSHLLAVFCVHSFGTLLAVSILYVPTLHLPNSKPYQAVDPNVTRTFLVQLDRWQLSYTPASASEYVLAYYQLFNRYRRPLHGQKMGSVLAAV